MKRFLTIFFTIVAVLAIDLVAKHFLFDVTYFNLIPHVISISTNGGNDGAAWGILGGKTIVLIVISVLMIVALFVYNFFVKKKTIFYCIAFGFIIGGALGNLFDRLTLGYVRDFIYLDFFPSFPVFNFADTFLTIGAIMMAIFILFMADKKNEK